jgi:hypothetical protein
MTKSISSLFQVRQHDGKRESLNDELVSAGELLIYWKTNGRCERFCVVGLPATTKTINNPSNSPAGSRRMRKRKTKTEDRKG